MEDNSIKIGTNIGSPIVTGHVQGNVSSDIKNSFNTYTCEQQQSLASAAAEIQQLLKQLEKNNPIATTVEKITYVNDQTTPSFKRRVVGALQAGSEVAVEEFLDNPYVNISKAIIKGWIKPE
jgi:hypothetical protein